MHFKKIVSILLISEIEKAGNALLKLLFSKDSSSQILLAIINDIKTTNRQFKDVNL